MTAVHNGTEQQNADRTGPRRAMPGLSAAFREVMGGVCAPVAVVTAMAGHRPHGSTVSAFASLSVEPVMVLVALDRGSDLLGHIRATGRFGVNVLGSKHSELALSFARKGAAKFDGVTWEADHDVPRLTGAPAGWPARSPTWSTGETIWSSSATCSRRRPGRARR